MLLCFGFVFQYHLSRTLISFFSVCYNLKRDNEYTELTVTHRRRLQDGLTRRTYSRLTPDDESTNLPFHYLELYLLLAAFIMLLVLTLQNMLFCRNVTL